MFIGTCDAKSIESVKIKGTTIELLLCHLTNSSQQVAVTIEKKDVVKLICHFGTISTLFFHIQKRFGSTVRASMNIKASSDGMFNQK